MGEERIEKKEKKGSTKVPLLTTFYIKARTNSSFDRHPIPPPWHRVIPSTCALATRVCSLQDHNLDVVK